MRQTERHYADRAERKSLLPAFPQFLFGSEPSLWSSAIFAATWPGTLAAAALRSPGEKTTSSRIHRAIAIELRASLKISKKRRVSALPLFHVPVTCRSVTRRVFERGPINVHRPRLRPQPR